MKTRLRHSDRTVLLAAALLVIGATDLQGQAGAGFNNRLLPGNARVSAQFAISDDTIGPEDVLVIATAPVNDSPPLNFAFLEQAALKPDQMEGEFRSALNTPAGRLLTAVAFGQGKGGGAAPELGKFAVQRVSWTKR